MAGSSKILTEACWPTWRMHAHLEAFHGAQDILAEQIRRGAPLDGQQFEICDEAGALLDTVRFRDVFRID
jgi:hypothetical protein